MALLYNNITSLLLSLEYLIALGGNLYTINYPDENEMSLRDLTA